MPDPVRGPRAVARSAPVLQLREKSQNPYNEYSALRVAIDASVAHVTIDNSPVNVLDARLIAELGALRDYASGENAQLTLTRGGEELTVDVPLGERDG